MAKKRASKNRFGARFTTSTDLSMVWGFELPVEDDPMVDPTTSMRRKPWSDDGFLE